MIYGKPATIGDHDRRSDLAASGARPAGGGGHLGEGTAGVRRGKKGFAWSHMRRAAPRTPRRPDPRVLAVRCALERKEMLSDAAPDRFFDDDHYRGYPAVLVRLDVVDEEELADLLLEAWRPMAPKRLTRSRL
jgi:hypothetical protein